jgi:predicted kinase
MIVIVTGLPGSGKSYFASRLASMLDADYINSDRIRKNLFTQRTYSEEEKLKVYEEMLLQMRKAVENNNNVVLDGTFYKNDIRRKFIKGIEGKEPVFFFEIYSDEPVIKERLKKDRPYSEADFEIYKKIKMQWEPIEEPHLLLQSTNDNIEDMLQKAANYLQLNNDKGTNK